jgi:hypothetical protein
VRSRSCRRSSEPGDVPTPSTGRPRAGVERRVGTCR